MNHPSNRNRNHRQEQEQDQDQDQDQDRNLRNQKQLCHSSSSSHSLLAHRHLNQIISRPLSPLFTLAAYSWIALAAFSTLVGLLLTGYGLSAWDDAKQKLTTVRGLVGKGLEVGKEIVGSLPSPHIPSTVRHPTSWPTRSAPQHPHPSLRSFNSFPSGSSSPSPYDLSNDEPSSPKKSSNQHQHIPSSKPNSDRDHLGLPPRPPLSVLIASLFLTLIVVAARLMVVWWMGQQGQKNRTHAFRKGRKAYEAAATQSDNQFPNQTWFPSSSSSVKHPQ
ncbi:hypothetical protein O181_054314 [Austropuccinia psidii MF-1]|uniref:Transmembrane protein n=1 Tax=Austropuccinia psidii MF-1 TaxID=1389203 RepID=A0A9Q3HTK1_9BASI|nr:hypothetical protein [Austropuccinia psidii MF-1]